ncbi:hypothetical protein Tcan_06012 [Toxocara canis]|nr:hypothetical protein Tcan_06021 [Toxocara canis]KHN76978.1 hypothetical protein Tcan_06012 [Toxocara canis]
MRSSAVCLLVALSCLFYNLIATPLTQKVLTQSEVPPNATTTTFRAKTDSPFRSSSTHSYSEHAFKCSLLVGCVVVFVLQPHRNAPHSKSIDPERSAAECDDHYVSCENRFAV